MARTIALIAALAGALIWAILAILPPAPRGGDAPAASFSAARAMVDVTAMSQAPHPTGSPADTRVRAHLAARLRALGAEVSEQATPLPAKSLARLGKWSGRPESGVIAHNLIGIIPGRDRSLPALMLMAHHDSVWGSPGAADDAVGVAAALEAARAIGAQGRAERDLILLFTDGEEIGLDGSTAFFDRHPLARRVGVIINMEARGGGGRANMFETGAGNGAMMRLYAETVDRPATNALSVLIYDLMPNYTDYTIAKGKGIPGFNLALLDRGYVYHSPLATPDNLDRASLQDMGDQTLALASALAFTSTLPPREDNAAFADLMGRVTIVYPPLVGWVVLLLGAALVGAALWHSRPARASIGGGMIIAVSLLLHGALLLTAFNALSGSGGANYYDRLAELPPLEILAALGTVAVLMLVPLMRRPEMHPVVLIPGMALMWAGLLTGGPLLVLVALAMLAMFSAWFLPEQCDDRGEGATLLLLAAAVLIQIVEPTIGPLLQWPLLLAGIAMAARIWLPRMAALVVTALCAAIGIGHLLAQAHFIFLGIGAEMPAVLMLLLFAALPLLLPLWPDRFPRWLPGGALAIALVVALWVRLDPIAPSIPTYSLTEGGIKTRD